MVLWKLADDEKEGKISDAAKKERTPKICLGVQFIVDRSRSGPDNSGLILPSNQAHPLTYFGNKYEPENVEVIEAIISTLMDENSGIFSTMGAAKTQPWKPSPNIVKEAIHQGRRTFVNENGGSQTGELCRQG